MTSKDLFVSNWGYINISKITCITCIYSTYKKFKNNKKLVCKQLTLLYKYGYIFVEEDHTCDLYASE
jgi:hypothetical protein